jgi:16S rRNA (adenine1518-N6/adenine1519-N6)-dimethyltransferase
MNGQNKSLGQHWLYDETALNEVADAADVTTGDTVLEVGPGLGTLTAILLARGATVIAVEKDKQLASRLRKTDQLKIVEADILEFDLTTLPSGYKVAANIPYYLTSPLIRMLLESTNSPSCIGLLIQKEVAERIVAQPGAMSVLSVSVQYYADVSLGSIVAAALFDPPPKVDSQIIRIAPKTSPSFEADTDIFFRLVRAGFSEKRKKLSNALSGGLHLDKEETKELLDDATIDQNVRAQELAMDDWERLYKTYSAAL